jgi:hypothetical protein
MMMKKPMRLLIVSEAEKVETTTSQRSGRGISRARGKSQSRACDADELNDEASGWQAFQLGEWCTYQAGKIVPEKGKGPQFSNRVKSTNLDCVIILNSGSTI